MDMVAVGDVLVVDDGGGDAAEAVAPLHVLEKLRLEFLGETVDDSGGVLAEDLHLALVGLAHAVALESVLVAALLLAHLAIPSQLLQTLCFDPVRDRLWGQEFVLPHRLGWISSSIVEFRVWWKIWGKGRKVNAGGGDEGIGSALRFVKAKRYRLIKLKRNLDFGKFNTTLIRK